VVRARATRATFSEAIDIAMHCRTAPCGGDSAVEEATFLTRFAAKVTIVHRRDEFRASQIMLERAKANDKIDWITNAVVEEVVGEERVTGVRLRDVNTGETWEIEADGVFAAIGHDPNTGLFLDQLEHDEAGYLITKPGTTETNVPGVFAVGDVRAGSVKRVASAVGEGSVVVSEIHQFLAAPQA
jgi:thioredoxin reductase (NADPH)